MLRNTTTTYKTVVHPLTIRNIFRDVLSTNTTNGLSKPKYKILYDILTRYEEIKIYQLITTTTQNHWLWNIFHIKKWHIKIHWLGHSFVESYIAFTKWNTNPFEALHHDEIVDHCSSNKLAFCWSLNNSHMTKLKKFIKDNPICKLRFEEHTSSIVYRTPIKKSLQNIITKYY